jgi:RNA polymerase sigma-70 factor (ECF subfamily)
MSQEAQADRERDRCFRDAALPHLAALHDYALSLTRSETDAQDAVQECYLLALRHFGGFRGGSMKAWLCTILRNVCYSDFARRARREQPVDPLEHRTLAEETLWLEAPATPEAILQRRQEDAIVRRLVGAMPTPLRDVILLRELHDLSYQEIARVSRAPVGTVMSRLSRARARLRSTWTSAQADDRRPCANEGLGRAARPL